MRPPRWRYRFFIGNGARGVCPDVTTVIVAHMHNFASARAMLWDRLVNRYPAAAPLPN